MSVTLRALVDDDLAGLGPLLERTPFRPLRYLRDVPADRVCGWWQEEMRAALAGPGGFGILAEADRQPAGACILGDLPWESGILSSRMMAIKHLLVAPEAAGAGQAAPALEALVARAVGCARERGADYVFCRTYTDEISKIHALEGHGFRLADTLLDFVLDMRRPRPAAPAPAPGVALRLAGPGDREGLIAAARAAFAVHCGRFHADPRIGPERGRTIYERWIASSLDGYADWIVVAEIGGRIAGYTAWKRPSERESRFGLGIGHYSIGAIHPDFHGRGLFSALTSRGPELLASLVDRIEGPTHINNYAVHRGYLNLGWRIEDARHSFHLWLNPQARPRTDP